VGMRKGGGRVVVEMGSRGLCGSPRQRERGEARRRRRRREERTAVVNFAAMFSFLETGPTGECDGGNIFPSVIRFGQSRGPTWQRSGPWDGIAKATCGSYQASVCFALVL
jgi:hypothetical protein